MINRRYTYIIRYDNAKSIRVSAVNEAQAWHIGRGVGSKHAWKTD